MALNDIKIHRILIPILNTLVWAIGLLMGIFGFMPKINVWQTQLVIGGWTVYFIFLLETVIYYLDLSVYHADRQFGSNVLIFISAVLLTTISAIFFGWLFIQYNQILVLGAMICSMIASKAIMVFMSNNLDFCFFKSKGLIYNSHI
ncbi:hypothetical protein [Phocaeicola barnesiae]|uniref:hypothetical protein n=1 Tax=Phocaeicola barnesiae TaxID=376804 RepID=UPI001D76840D|nr:hypothetical protein [Phocaeicola barnesiae]HJG76943.1 hypothetical protein [Phocaeicola barnesiae]